MQSLSTAWDFELASNLTQYPIWDLAGLSNFFFNRPASYLSMSWSQYNFLFIIQLSNLRDIFYTVFLLKTLT